MGGDTGRAAAGCAAPAGTETRLFCDAILAGAKSICSAYTKNVHCQDRLAPDIGKAHSKKRDAFLQGDMPMHLPDAPEPATPWQPWQPRRGNQKQSFFDAG